MEVPVEEVTVTCTIPDPGGVVAVIEVPEDPTLTSVAGAPPNETVESAVNPAPVIVTEAPPLALPELGLTPVTTGVYENSALLVTGEVPPSFVTVTGTDPIPAGEVALIEVSFCTETSTAGVSPKDTVESGVKPFPVIVTLVPPVAGPEFVLMEFTTGV